ncbi:aliphatic sulfonate ABC transporter substrate-binding protein [Arboricoccus pini]|uniref:aliphatic sulfonate ABC transporter substrate-binding protein n=1 Tax=Arboricoccus pini TaxID=1963835 RepID=UPI0013FE2B8B|nr:aliphatic sulfonate ABC transporter substrate-binding protein [Arboricoccus pini]
MSAKPSSVLRIGWLKGTNTLTLLKARQEFLAGMGAEGIDVEWAGPFPASSPAVEAMTASAIDVTVGSSTSSVVALAAGAPIVLFTYQPLGPQGEAIIVRKADDIRTVADLVGRRVAVNRGGTGEYLLRLAMSRYDLPEGSLTTVYLSPADAGNAFLQGAVDAWAIWDPWLTIALTRYDARVLLDRSAIGSENAIVTLASEEFVARDPKCLQLLFDALLQANQWAVAHPEQAGSMWAAAMDLPSTLGAPLGNHNAVPERGIARGDLKTLETIGRWYRQAGMIGQLPNLSKAIVELEPSLPAGPERN